MPRSVRVRWMALLLGVTLRSALVHAATCSPDAAAIATLSGDGDWVLLADSPTARLRLFDAAGQEHRLDVGADAPPAVVAQALLAAPARRSLIAVLQSPAEVWEISLDPQAEPLFDGWVHDYRSGEGVPRPGYLGARRTRLAAPLTGDLFSAWDRGALVSVDPAVPTSARVLLLDVRREIPQRSWTPPSGDVDLAPLVIQGQALALSRVAPQHERSQAARRALAARQLHCTP